jgi:WD40 repeat protein
MFASRAHIIILTLLLLPATFAAGAQPPQPKADERTPKTDFYADPLPPGALARMGSAKLRHDAYAEVAFARDGKTLISLGRDHTVCTWDVATGKMKSWRKLELPPIDQNLNPRTVLSPSGELIAFTNKSGVTIHDAATGKQRHRVANEFPDHSGHVLDLNGNTLVTCTRQENKYEQIRLWDTSTGKQRAMLELKEPISIWSISACPVTASSWEFWIM